MFKDLAFFSSFIESIIALSFFLSAWKKPEEVFSDLLKKSFSNEKILLSEKKFWIDAISKLFNSILRFARWISIPAILYGLTILFLSGSCNYDNSQSICQYSVGADNRSISIHLLILLLPILLNLFAFILGIIYYITTLALISLMNAKTWLINSIKKRKEDRKKLSILSAYSSEDLKEIIKNKDEYK